MADSSKTEKATPKKRRDERKKGHIVFSNDAVSVVVLLACFWTIKLLGPSAAEELASFFRLCMQMSADSAELPDTELVIRLLVTFAKTAGPLLAVSVAVGLGATFFQTKFLVSGESIRPKLSRLNPIQGFTRLFSLRSIIEALKGLLKILLLLVLIYQFISGVVGMFTKYLDTDLLAACAHLFDETFQMVNQILLVYVVLAGADVFYQWWDYERQMRMSKQEIKEEYKQMEGDPQVKGKIKEAQRRRAQSRMMQQVPQADVRPTWSSVTPPTSRWPCGTTPSGMTRPLFWPRDRMNWRCALSVLPRSTRLPWWKTFPWPVPSTPPLS